MKRFTWRLQRILDIKDKAERLKRAELLQLGERVAEAHALLRVQERILHATLKNAGRVPAGQRAETQALALRQATYNEQRMQQLRHTIARLEADKQAKAAEVTTLRREREALERLRTQAAEVYVADQERAAQKELDELAGQRFAGTRVREASQERPYE